MKPSIGLKDKTLKLIITHLTTLLADESILYIKTRNFHWNVEGVLFNDLHKFFESQYGELEVIIDEVAERIRMLGSKSIGTMQEFLKHARLKEKINYYPSALVMVEELLKDHELIISCLRETIKVAQNESDEGSANFLTDLLEKHEKFAWMLRSYLVD